jgi:hypothetical protein
MAVAAIQSQLANMVFMAEWNGLRTRVIYFGDVGCLVDDIHRIAQEANEDHRAVNT